MKTYLVRLFGLAEMKPVLLLVLLILSAFCLLVASIVLWIEPLCSKEDSYELIVQQTQPHWTKNYTKYSGHESGGSNENNKTTNPLVLANESQSKIQDDKIHGEKENKHWYYREWWKKFFCELKIGDFAIGFFTFCLVIVGGFQAYWMWRTLATADKALIAGERAFVFPKAFLFSFRPDKDGKKRYRFQVAWENSGDTPTKKMRTHVEVQLRDAEIPDNFDFRYETTKIARGIIGPKSSITSGEFPSEGITPEDMDAVMQGTKFLYIWGWVKYFDVLSDSTEHITRFFCFINPLGTPSNPGEKLENVHFTYPIQPRNNCSDDECENQ